MAVRRWQIHPDVMHPTLGVPVLSHTTFIEGVADGVAMMQRAGGVLSVVAERINSDLPGEMVTILAVCEWKDRTDAKPQPEQATQLVPQQVSEPSPDDVAVSQIAALQAAAEEFGLTLAMPPDEGGPSIVPDPSPAVAVEKPDPVPVIPDPVPPAPAPEPDDGFDKSELPDEDNSSIPPTER